jgi:hypothetical protein
VDCCSPKINLDLTLFGCTFGFLCLKIEVSSKDEEVPEGVQKK